MNLQNELAVLQSLLGLCATSWSVWLQAGFPLTENSTAVGRRIPSFKMVRSRRRNRPTLQHAPRWESYEGEAALDFQAVASWGAGETYLAVGPQNKYRILICTLP